MAKEIYELLDGKNVKEAIRRMTKYPNVIKWKNPTDYNRTLLHEAAYQNAAEFISSLLSVMFMSKPQKWKYHFIDTSLYFHLATFSVSSIFQHHSLNNDVQKHIDERTWQGFTPLALVSFDAVILGDSPLDLLV